MIFSQQVHIVFNSQETDRITKPLLQNPPHKLYYFTAYIKKTKQKDANLKFMEQNIDTIQTHIPSITIIRKQIDYVDYIEIIQQISQIVKIERENNPNTTIYINISSGSKITAIASIEASKIWDLEYYYVYSSQYDPYEEGPLHTGDIIIMKPTTFPTQRPHKDHIRTLKLINKMIEERFAKKQLPKDKLQTVEKFIYMKDLINKLESNGVVQLDNKHRDPQKRKSALYMKVKDFLNPIANGLGYIEISNEKRNKHVTLTEKGKELIQIFQFLD